MKKALLILLALVFTLSVCTTPALAKGDHRFNFVWGDHDFDMDFNDGKKPGEGHHQKPATPTDAPDDDRNDKDDHQNQKPQDKPQKPARPVTDTDATGSDVTETDVTCTDIFDAIAHLKHKGHHGRHFRMPKNDHKFMLVDMLVKEDGSVDFGYMVKGEEDKGVQRLPMNDEAAAPEDMQFIVLGDNNLDGAVDAKDALNILKHAVKKAVMEHEGQQFLSDMNEDGALDSKDALGVLKKAVGK